MGANRLEASHPDLECTFGLRWTTLGFPTPRIDPVMKCPFLRESWVKFCQASPYRKVIEQTAESAADLCTSSAFQACAAFKEHRKSPSTPPCPFLQEARAQVCSHDPSVRFVPCCDQVHSRCVTDNHRYCESYLAAAHRLGRTLGLSTQQRRP